MLITILNVSSPEQPAGKKYYSLEVAYKDEQGRTNSKKLMSFSNPQVFKEVQNFGSGDVAEVTVTKNSAGYLDWVAIKASNGAIAAAAPAASGKGSPAPRGNFETPEERAARQVYIVRQSSLSTAVSILTTGAKSSPSVDDVITVAKQLEDYVFGNNQPEKASDPADLSDVEDDIIL